MKDDALKRIIDDASAYDEPREDTLRSMLADFYSRRNRTVALIVWIYGLVFMGVAVASAVLFFQAESVKYQILYATVFIVMLQWVGLLKIFAWQTMHKNSVKREIKRLELRLEQMGRKPGGG